MNLRSLYWSLWNGITSRYPLGENVFEREWDLLINLDTCRVDALRAVSDEYDFLGDVGRLFSVGSHSAEWMVNTFTESYRDEIQKTVFVSGNVWAHRILNERIHEQIVQSDYSESSYRYFTQTGLEAWRTVHGSTLRHLDHSWQAALEQTGRVHAAGHGAPDVHTDRAIALGREYDPERMIVHYSLPHSPYVANAVAENRDLYEYESDPFTALQTGTAFETVYESYLDNLRFVLDHVEVLLDNYDATTVAISADHGESFGEYGLYGHKFGVPAPHVRYVPWAQTTATDTETHTPSSPEPDLNDVEKVQTDELLRTLGYLPDEGD